MSLELTPEISPSAISSVRTVELAGFWPEPDEPVDLRIHDPAHDLASLEWWYVHGHLQGENDAEYAFFASFFRFERQVREAGEDPDELCHMHALTWRLTRLGDGEVIQRTLLDPTTPAEVAHRLRTAEGDTHFRRALQELVDDGSVPVPDRLMSRSVSAATDRLVLDYDGNGFESLGDGAYRLHLSDAAEDLDIDLTFRLAKPITRHGNDGYVAGTAAQKMFYYFCPRCPAEGSIRRGQESERITGEVWYDHEFGRDEEDQAPRPEGSAKVAWNWIAAQLDNGWEVSAYDLFDMAADGQSAGKWLVAIDPEGRRHAATEFTLSPEEWTRSTRTFVHWPISWRLEVPALNLDVAVSAPLPDQEYQTLLSQPAFWEGRVDLTGSMDGLPTSGKGFVERSGFEADRGIPEFLGDVGSATQAALRRLLPDEPTAADAVRLVARPGFPRHTQGMDPQRLQRLVLAPIRHVTDLGGKAWRSYALLSCIDLVGGDSRKHADWLAIPELIHVGSLIVDDVQDRSTLRRGGQPAHRIWGEPLALNAGTAAYFLSHSLLEEADLSPETKVRVYEVFFHTMRGAHVGQAFDIAGHHDTMQRAILANDPQILLDEVLLTHRLKSAVPAGNLARMGAIVGGGSRQQEAALGNYFEALGVAFQVVDDVIDIRGTGGLKRQGGDLLEGKVTAPVALGLTRMDAGDATRVTDYLLADSRTEGEVKWIIGVLEECGALDAATSLANQMLEEAWAELTPLIEPSFTKLYLRSYSSYLLERQY